MSQQTTLIEIGVNAAGHYDVRMARLLSNIMTEAEPSEIYEFQMQCEKAAQLMYHAGKKLIEKVIPSEEDIKNK